LKRTLLAIVCLSSAGAVAVATTWAASPAITETSIASARLGQTAAAYKALFGGHPTRADAGNDLSMLSFAKRKVNVYLDGAGKAVIITTWNRSYKTDRGVGPCSTIAELKKAYGSSVHPDHFGTIGTTYFSYDVGKNLVFAAPGPAGSPSKFVTAIGLFNGNAPHANENGGARPVAGYTTGYKTPTCR
jgi:hypothetical protein